MSPKSNFASSTQGISLFSLLLINAVLVCGQSAISLQPGSIPLVNRSPYFNYWLPRNNASTPATGGVWPSFWNNNLVGWLGFIRVDGKTYQWLGVGGVNSTTTVASYTTPTQTTFSLEAGPVNFNLTFLNPIEPSDWIRQSFPFSYIAIDVASSDGQGHAVQVYTDVTGEWVSGNNTNVVQWNTTHTKASIYHAIQQTNIVSMSEDNDLAGDGTVYLATSNAASATTQTGAGASVRTYFDQHGALTNGGDTQAQPISPSYPVIAIAIDLGNIRSTSSRAVWAIGFVRDPVIRYIKGSSVEFRSSYFWTDYSEIGDAIDDFLSDFDDSLTRAQALDTRIMTDAGAISQEYADLVGLSLRQTMAAVDITVSKAADGGWNYTDVKAFMKDIGNSRRANPVETLYASFPSILYLNASLGGLLLDPLLEYQASPQYRNVFAAPDLGASYPDAPGNNTDTTTLGVENCGSMLVMALAYAQKSGRGSLLNYYLPLFRKWADYLVTNALHPTRYVTADGRNSDNSNLALKGILGIYAMGKINEALEPHGASPNVTLYYTNTSRSQYSAWEDLALTSGRVVSSYGQASSWALIYNLFAAKLIGADIVDQSIYEAQATFYSSQLASAGPFGLPYDSNDQFVVKSHWTMFTAATVNNTAVRNSFISSIHNRTFLTGVTPPFATTWDTRSGVIASIQGGRASAAQGAMLALLALNIPNVPISLSAIPAASAPASAPSKSKSGVAAIAGGVVGGIAGFALICIAIFFYWRKRKAVEKQAKLGNLSARPFIPPPRPPPIVVVGNGDGEKSVLSSLLTRSQKSRSGSETHPGMPLTSTSASTGRERSSSARSPVIEVAPASSSLTSLNNPSTQSPTTPSSNPLPPIPEIPRFSKATLMAESNASSSDLGRSLPTGGISSSISAATASGDLHSDWGAQDLRAEMEQLRRQMAEMRAQALVVDDEPPPSYS